MALLRCAGLAPMRQMKLAHVATRPTSFAAGGTAGLTAAVIRDQRLRHAVVAVLPMTGVTTLCRAGTAAAVFCRCGADRAHDVMAAGVFCASARTFGCATNLK